MVWGDEEIEEALDDGRVSSPLPVAPCGVGEALWSRLDYVTSFGDVFEISKTQCKAGKKIVARLKACQRRFSDSANPIQTEIDEHTETTRIAIAFMVKHLGENDDDSISLLIQRVP